MLNNENNYSESVRELESYFSNSTKLDTTPPLTSTTIMKLTETTTTAKVHLMKPEAVDGSQLEQAHITKPPVKPIEPTTSTLLPPIDQDAFMNKCLIQMNRTCIMELRVDDTEDSEQFYGKNKTHFNYN
jgi:hypothetical protein